MRLILQPTNSYLCIYDLLLWSNFNFLHNSLRIAIPTQSFLGVYSFCACLLHLLVLWWIVSCLLSHDSHLLFCCVLAFFYGVILGNYLKRFSLSLKVSLLSHAPVLSREISSVFCLKYPYSFFSQFLFPSRCSCWSLCFQGRFWPLSLFFIYLFFFFCNLRVLKIGASTLFSMVACPFPLFSSTHIICRLYAINFICMSFLECMALCIVISFLVLWSTSLSSLFIYLRMSGVSFKGGQPRCLSILWNPCNRTWF